MTLLALAPSLASAHGGTGGDGGLAPCHILCVNRAGRAEGEHGDAIPRERWSLHVDALSIVPQGQWTSAGYTARPAGSTAFAAELVPTLTYRANRWLSISGGMPQEFNHSRGVVIPTMLPAEGSHSEVAPGRLWAAAHARIAVPDDWQATPIVGAGYGFSSSKGTSDIRDNLPTIPQVGIEGLGIGSDDLYLTGRLVTRSAGPWEASVGLEGRLHMLPKWQKIFGTTAAYDLYVGRHVGHDWTVGVHAGGFNTILTAVGVEERSLLEIAPVVSRPVARNVRLSAGYDTVVPGRTLNENALQFQGPIAGVDVTF
jgi:hypothetical protein